MCIRDRNGTVRERMADASELITALSFVVPGMPLIYSGQEYDLDHRLLFFEKDQIPKTKKVMWPLLEKLGQIKNSNPALSGGKIPANYQKIDLNNSSILSFKRQKDNHVVTFIGNFSSEYQTVNNPVNGNLNYLTGVMESAELIIDPWGFKILIQN